MRVSQHAKMRMKERVIGVNSYADAEKLAQRAFRSGTPASRIEDETLRNRCENMARSCSKHALCKVYEENIFLFKGSKEKTLITVIPVEQDENRPQRVYMSGYLMNWEEINEYEVSKRYGKI